jgi:hypothetical protein
MKTSLDLDDINRAIKSAAYHQFPGTTLTVCCLTLQDGFNVVGQSACIDPAAFDEAFGRKIAHDDAVNKVWQLEGYLLNYKLKRGIEVADEPANEEPPEPMAGLHFDQVLAASTAPVPQASAESVLAPVAAPEAAPLASLTSDDIASLSQASLPPVAPEAAQPAQADAVPPLAPSA